MTIQSGFFNSINRDRKYDASWFAQYFASFIGNGVFPTPSNSLQIVEAENMNIVVKPGKGWINGYFVVNDGDYTLTLDNADGVLKRIDRVVMRLNFLTRQIEVVVKKGVFASNPVVPALQRDTEYYELGLADVTINNGAVQITQANITDTRLNNDLCGIVHGVVDQVDTTTIFNQYQSWVNQQRAIYEADYADWAIDKRLEIDNWQVQEQDDFEAWFQSIQGILNGDVAGNLLNEINKLKSDLGDKNTLLTTNKTTIVAALNELFTNANNLKNDWASVIGSPLLVSDTSAQLKSKTQTIKNTLAANLTNKGQPSGATEPLLDLISKVGIIKTGKQIISSSFSVPKLGNNSEQVVRINLDFTPKFCIAYHVQLDNASRLIIRNDAGYLNSIQNPSSNIYVSPNRTNVEILPFAANYVDVRFWTNYSLSSSTNLMYVLIIE